MIYSGIGSRETPADIRALMTGIASILDSAGWQLRSGHAKGADQAFEQGSMNKEVYLPWNGFQGGKVDNHTYFTASHTELPAMEEIAAKFHPNWAACNFTARSFHSRNVWQIVGRDLLTPSNMVICWTKDGKASGGTGQAIRIAEFLEIPIFNLHDSTAIQRLEDFVNGLKP